MPKTSRECCHCGSTDFFQRFVIGSILIVPLIFAFVYMVVISFFSARSPYAEEMSMSLPLPLQAVLASRVYAAFVTVGAINWGSLCVYYYRTYSIRKQQARELRAQNERERKVSEVTVTAAEAAALPMVTMIMAVKMCSVKIDNPIENWKTQIKTGYKGPMEYIFVVEDMEDGAVPLIHQLQEELGAGYTVRVLAAGLTSTCSQKLHNQVFAVDRSDPKSKYIFCVDVNVKLHSNTITNNVQRMEDAKGGIFLITGYPLDMPEVGGSIWSHVIMNFRWTSGLSAFKREQSKVGVWGGHIFMESKSWNDPGLRADARTALYDDNFLAGYANSRDLKIILPLVNLFPTELKKNTPRYASYHFIVRQIFALRTYATTLNGLEHHALIAVCLFFHLVCLSSILAYMSAVLFACLYPAAVVAYPKVFVVAAADLLLHLVYIMTLKKMVQASSEAAIQVDPSRNLKEMHVSYFKLYGSIILTHFVVIPAVLHALFNSELNWGNIVYTVTWGRLVKVTHPAPVKVKNN